MSTNLFPSKKVRLLEWQERVWVPAAPACRLCQSPQPPLAGPTLRIRHGAPNCGGSGAPESLPPKSEIGDGQ